MNHRIQVDPNSPTHALLEVSEDAAYIMERVGIGRVLRHQDGRLSWLIQKLEPGEPPTFPNPPVYDANLRIAAFWELRHADLIYRLTEERAGSRCGWKELGLNGADCELFVSMM